MIRFLADACLPDYLVSGCLRREPAMDFKSALAAKLEGKTDPQVLERRSAEVRAFCAPLRLFAGPRHFAFES